MDWSPVYRELFLATYRSSSSNTTTSSVSTTAVQALLKDTNSASLTPRSVSEVQSDGLALLWSLSMPTRPEHVFTCGSPVLCGRFHPTEATFVVGGCESGQLVIWDTRAGRLPVQKSASVVGASAASNKGHLYPIGGMEIIEGGVRETRDECFCCCLYY
jgi:WD40 repeat protein